MTWCPDVRADKPHPQIDTKILSKRCGLFDGVYGSAPKDVVTIIIYMSGFMKTMLKTESTVFFLLLIFTLIYFFSFAMTAACNIYLA